MTAWDEETPVSAKLAQLLRDNTWNSETTALIIPDRRTADVYLSERLHKRAAKGRYPLIWAKAITPEGTFDFERGAAFKGYGWADAPTDAPYVIRTACIAVQRTSSRGQKRRLNAASISKAFIQKHGGVVAENHVILLVPNSPDAASPESLAEALNNAAASAALDRVCGSASISVRLLETIKLEARPTVCARPLPGRSETRIQPQIAVAL